MKRYEAPQIIEEYIGFEAICDNIATSGDSLGNKSTIKIPGINV